MGGIGGEMTGRWERVFACEMSEEASGSDCEGYSDALDCGTGEDFLALCAGSRSVKVGER